LFSRWNDSSPGNYSSTSSDSSIDLDESFKKLLESRRQKCDARKTLIKKAISNSNANNSPLACANNDKEEMNDKNTNFIDLRTPLRGANTSLWQCHDTTTVEEEEDWRKVSEDSFAANEQFCDSLSPATSKYTNEDFSVDSLNSNANHKTKLIDLTTDDDEGLDSDELEARALEYTSTYEPTENSAMNRLLKELDASDQQAKIQPKPSKQQLPDFMADETQLNDIEAPSALWENTMFSNSPRPSPMKKMGMLRPSTILEEDTLVNFSNELSRRESNESYKTAYVDGKEKKGNETAASTEDFRTADEEQEDHSCASNVMESPTMLEVIEITDESCVDVRIEVREFLHYVQNEEFY
jgi:hypothetical protein